MTPKHQFNPVTMKSYNEPEEDLYLLADNVSSPAKKRIPKLKTSNSYRFAAASIFLFFLGIVHIKVSKESLNLSFDKVLTPEQAFEAQEGAIQATRESREKLATRLAWIAQYYMPAADYQDPCDTAREDCCTDSNFPVLGGLDVVSFYFEGGIVFGDPQFSARIKVANARTYTFWFSDPLFVSLFEKSPESYLPKWGGFNAEKFCSGEENFTSFISNTVELSEVWGFFGHTAFGDVLQQDIESCDDRFETFFAKPNMDVYNTRCISMNQFETLVPGLLTTMPSLSKPIKMSQLVREMDKAVAKVFFAGASDLVQPA